MNRKLKRWLALLLTLAMVFSLMSTGGWAAELEPERTDTEDVTAVEETEEEPEAEADASTEADEEIEAEDISEGEVWYESEAVSEVPALLGETGGQVTYLDESGAEQTAESTTSVTSDDTEWSDGWYVVDSILSNDNRILVVGTVNLILCDGKKLTASAGITVEEGKTLNIHAQSSGSNMGELEATGGSLAAGIGGDSGGTGSCGTITIYNGKITAAGGSSAAGIGGGLGNNGGVITINGGNLDATGGSGAAGIGGGYDGGEGGSITITGGTVTANGSSAGDRGGAGIGGGAGGAGGTIVISGGSVTATGSNAAVGIGGGDCGEGGIITIRGGEVAATGGTGDRGGAGIGGGWFEDINHSVVTISGGNVQATGKNGGAGIGGSASQYGGVITISGGCVTAFADFQEEGRPCEAIGNGLLEDGDEALDSVNLTISNSDNTSLMFGALAGNNEDDVHLIPVEEFAANRTDYHYAQIKAIAVVKTAPVAQELTYNGTAQDLVTEGTSDDGTLQYKLGDDGSYSDTVPKATDAGEYTVFYAVVDPSGIVFDSPEESVMLTIGQAYPIANAPTGLTAAYGQTLADVSLTNPQGNTPGTWVWVDSTASVGSAGTNTFQANFTPTDSTNYSGKSNVDVTVVVGKANPTASAPTGLTATYGQTLADVTLTNPQGNTPGTWAWVDSTASVGDTGSHTFKANFTPTDTTNYNGVQNVDIAVNVAKADLDLTLTLVARSNSGVTRNRWPYHGVPGVPNLACSVHDYSLPVYSYKERTAFEYQPYTVEELETLNAGQYCLRVEILGPETIMAVRERQSSPSRRLRMMMLMSARSVLPAMRMTSHWI